MHATRELNVYSARCTLSSVKTSYVRLSSGFGAHTEIIASRNAPGKRSQQHAETVLLPALSVKSVRVMVKRKRDALPKVVHMQPVKDADGTRIGPFAVYFPSGFVPTSDASCTWHVYTHKTHKQQHIIVARTVSCAGLSPCTKYSPPLYLRLTKSALHRTR